MKLIDVDKLIQDIVNTPTEYEDKDMPLSTQLNGMAFRQIEILGLIEKQPIISQHSDWIPVSERLPDYDGYDEIIATVDGEHCGVQYINAVVTDVYFEDGGWYMHGLKTENIKVLAWQPLPEPWRGEGK